MKLNAKELREVDEKEIADNLKKIKRRPIYFILENIYDTYNIGGLFRLADALAIEKIYLCGETEIPPNSRIKKASIGTYKVVNWEYKKSAKEAIDDLKFKFQNPNDKSNPNSKIQKNVILGSEETNSRRAIPESKLDSGRVHSSPTRSLARMTNKPKIIAVEQAPNSIPYTKADYSLPLVLIFGNETYGVTKETLKLADQIVEIPMFGINKSLNVIVSAAIVSYRIASLEI